MKYLLEEIERKGEISVPKFLGTFAHKFGIRRVTVLEYLRDWIDAEYITIENNVIKFLKKPED